MSEKDINKEIRLKHTLEIQVIKDILVENKLTTHQEFRERFLRKLSDSGISEELQDALKK